MNRRRSSPRASAPLTLRERRLLAQAAEAILEGSLPWEPDPGVTYEQEAAILRAAADKLRASLARALRR
jgi:hypothetical protein